MQITRRTTMAIALTGALAAGAVGCGTTKHKNVLRPPAPILLNSAITPEKISVSPRAIGAGPITMVFTNLTGSSQQVTFESAGAPGGTVPGIRQQTGPINPNDTATLKATVVRGLYRVRVSGDSVAPTTLAVGPPPPVVAERPDAALGTAPRQDRPRRRRGLMVFKHRRDVRLDRPPQKSRPPTRRTVTTITLE